MISDHHNKTDEKTNSLVKKKEKHISDEDVEEKSPSIKKPNAFSSAQNQINIVTAKNKTKKKTVYNKLFELNPLTIHFA